MKNQKSHQFWLVWKPEPSQETPVFLKRTG
jgi:hypothetical protein